MRYSSCSGSVMQFSDSKKYKLPLSLRIVLISMAWIVLISGLHFRLNLYEDKRKVIKMGYMPVMTNLSAPLLDYVSSKGDGEICFKALKFASFAEMAEALRNDQIQAAFIIAPLAIVLRQQGADVKIVYVGNRHESTLVTRKTLNVTSLEGLVGKTVAVPMRYSGHNISLLQQLDAKGLSGRVNIVELNPPDMAAALSTGALDAYFVGEPFAAQTLQNGDASLLFYVEDIWKNFICNLVITKKSFIDNDSEAVNTMVQGAVRAGFWAQNNLDEAAEIASHYWNQPVELIKYALSNPENRTVFNRFTPRQDEMQHIADLMVRFDLLSDNDISGLVDDQFARNAEVTAITDINSILAH